MTSENFLTGLSLAVVVLAEMLPSDILRELRGSSTFGRGLGFFFLTFGGGLKL